MQAEKHDLNTKDHISRSTQKVTQESVIRIQRKKITAVPGLGVLIAITKRGFQFFNILFRR